MYKKLCFIFFPLVLFFLSGQSQAADKGLELGVNAGYGLYAEADHENGFAASALLRYNLSKLFLLELSGGIQTAGTRNDPQGLNDGALTLYPVQLSVFIRFYLAKGFNPGLGGGGGYAWSSFKLDDERDWNQIGFSVMQKLKEGPLFHGAAAIDIVLSPKVTFFLEGRYCSGRFDGEYEISDRVSSESVRGSWKENLNSTVVSAGICVSLKKTPTVQRFVVPEKKKN